jgi:hypothetical protein
MMSPTRDCCEILRFLPLPVFALLAVRVNRHFIFGSLSSLQIFLLLFFLFDGLWACCVAFSQRRIFLNDSSERPQIGWVRINWDHLGLGSSEIISSGIIWDHLGSSRIIWIWDHLRSPRLGSSGIIWYHLGPSGIIWVGDHLRSSRLGSSWIVLDHLGSSGIIWVWDHLRASGIIWAHQGSSGSGII